MANNAKTPAMVLQELTVKKNMSSPEYTIIHARQGTHDNEFHYQVKTMGIVATGVGRSKQVAKHNAAQKALDILSKMGDYTPDETPIKPPKSEMINDSPIQDSVNSIGVLSELCLENKLPHPVFEEISDVGPPHCKEFTYQCKIVSLMTRATASTKKQSKQLAAKEMLEKITRVLPELVLECNQSLKAILDREEDVLEQFKKKKQFSRAKPNLGLKIEDYSKVLKRKIVELEVDSKDIMAHFDKELDESNLNEMLTKLELDYEIRPFLESSFMVTLTVNTDVPFVVLSEGVDYAEASKAAVGKVFTYLKILLD